MTVLSNTHPMSTLSRGGASAVMEAAQDGNPAVVMKNSRPYRVVSTVADYEHAQELEEDVVLLAKKFLPFTSGKLKDKRVSVRPIRRNCSTC